MPSLLSSANAPSKNSSIASFLFPIFASYKALKTSDPAQLVPWLMYWVVFSCCLLAESWVYFILAWYVVQLLPRCRLTLLVMHTHTFCFGG